MEIETTDENFEDKVIEKSKQIPVLVDFWASWCGPCMMLKPILEKISNSEKFKNKFILAKCNVEENQNISSEYGIMSIPAVKLFKEGKIVDEFIGAQPESKITEWLEQVL